MKFYDEYLNKIFQTQNVVGYNSLINREKTKTYRCYTTI